MTCLNPGRAEISSPVLTGPVAIPGVVLFLGAAIPGGPRMGGTTGDQSGGAEPQTRRTERLEGAQRERLRASAEAQESGLSVRQTAPPRVPARLIAQAAALTGSSIVMRVGYTRGSTCEQDLDLRKVGCEKLVADAAREATLRARTGAGTL
jgi:hypothetical protein